MSAHVARGDFLGIAQAAMRHHECEYFPAGLLRLQQADNGRNICIQQFGDLMAIALP